MNDQTERRPIGYSNTWVKTLRQPVGWLWDGVLAEGAVTLLSAPEKIGKSTLLSLLLDRRPAGGICGHRGRDGDPARPGRDAPPHLHGRGSLPGNAAKRERRVERRGY